MKKAIIAISAIALFAFAPKESSRINEKQYTFKYSEHEVQDMWRQMSEVQVYLDNTNLPHKEVQYFENKIDSVKQKILVQYRQQQDTTKK